MERVVWSPTQKREDVEIKQENLIYRGVFQLSQWELRHRCFDGQWSPWLSRELIERRDAVAAILVDEHRQKIVLVEQFRVGLIRKADQSPWMLEIVAGLVEPGELAEETMRREAVEEAGCEIESLVKIIDFYNTPGGFSEKTSVYCGMVNSDTVRKQGGVLAEHEDILVHVLDPEKVFDAMATGVVVTSASTVIALQWLRERWNGGKMTRA